MISKISNPKPITHSASSKFVQKVGRALTSIVLIPNILPGAVRPLQAVELTSLAIPPTRIEKIAISSEKVKVCQEERNNLESQIKSLELKQKLLPGQTADIKANIEEETKLLNILLAKQNPSKEDQQEINEITNLLDRGREIIGILDKQSSQFDNQIIALKEELKQACSTLRVPTPDAPESL